LYYLRVIPIIPVNGTYQLRVQISHSWDAGEVDDNVLDANQHWLPLNVNQTLDNPIDVDWFRFNTHQQNMVNITLSNVPNGAVYALIIYDANLNVLGSFTSSGSASRQWPLPRHSTFFVEVFSVNGGFSATQNYRLNIRPYDQVTVTPGGNIAGVIHNQLYIDGFLVNRTGTVLDRSSQTFPTGPNTWSTRHQSWVSIAGTPVFPLFGTGGIMGTGHYTGRILADPTFGNLTNNNVVVVFVSDFSSRYTYTRRVNFQIVHQVVNNWEVRSAHGNFSLMVVCATTRQIIDFPYTSAAYELYGYLARLNGQIL
jgi:hypothetical protein